MQKSCAKKKWAASSPFPPLIHSNNSRKPDEFEDRLPVRGACLPGSDRPTGPRGPRYRLAPAGRPQYDGPPPPARASQPSLKAAPHAPAVRGERVARLLPQELPAAAPGVRLWWCRLDCGAEDIDSIASWLSPAESARAQRFGTDGLRVRWIAGRAALRMVLGSALGVDPAAVALGRGVRGRPELDNARFGIDFNVSHTRDVALIAVARGLPAGTRVGVDIEHRDRDVGADRLARKFLSPRERATLADLAPDVRRQRFLRHWTCKEAMSKATGDGIAAPFGRLDIEISKPPRLVDGPAPYLPGHWSLSYAEVPDEWLATVALWRGAR